MSRARLHQRRRAAARTALYSSLVLVGLVCAALFPMARALRFDLDQSWADYDYAGDVTVRRLQSLVQIDTTPDTGREIDAARFLEGELDAAGIRVVVEELDGAKANLWAIIEGKSSEALVLHSHLDTDPIEQPELWFHPPFSGLLEPPWIWGRGSFDMKSLTVAQLEVMLEIQKRIDSGSDRPERSLMLLATSSEETGSEQGTKRVLREHPELVERMWAVLTEGGVLEATDRQQVKYWGTSFAQKTFLEVQARSDSEERLRQLLHALFEHGKPPRAQAVPDEVRSFLEVYGPSRDHPDFVRALADPDALLDDPETFALLPDYLKALFRHEAHPFQIVADPEFGGYRMKIVIHVLPGESVEEAVSSLLPPALTEGIDLTFKDPMAADHGSSLDHPVYQTVTATIEELRKPQLAGPYFLSFYANDSRFFRTLDIPSYGFTPFVFFSVDTFSVAGPNERVALPAFLEGVELYQETISRILALPSDSRKPDAV